MNENPLIQDRTCSAHSGMSDFGGVLDDVLAHWSRYILTGNLGDLQILALWTAHTYFMDVLYTTPRLLLDSMLPGSGKTTVLEHLERLTWKAIQAASLSSPALLARMLQKEPLALLIDEVGRNLDPKEPGVKELLAILNAGYKRGAKRPVLVPGKGGDWNVENMACYGPVAMAGIAPNLEDDTRSRSIRILLMPDLDGRVESTDWEEIEEATIRLHERLEAVADQVREEIRMIRPDLPDGCVGRIKEKWSPLARVAHVAGGHWAQEIDNLIARDIEEIEAEKAEGLATMRPEIQLVTDLHSVWSAEELFLPSKELVRRLIEHRPAYWGKESSYGRDLTPQRFGRLVIKGTKIRSQKDAQDHRGYSRRDFSTIWSRLGLDASDGSDGFDGSMETLDGQTVPPLKQTVETVGSVQTVADPVPRVYVDQDEFTDCADCHKPISRNQVIKGRCSDCAKKKVA